MALLAQASVQLNEIALVPDSLLCMSVCQCSAGECSASAPRRRSNAKVNRVTRLGISIFADLTSFGCESSMFTFSLHVPKDGFSYTQYGPITNVGIFPGLGVLYFCPDFQG